MSAALACQFFAVFSRFEFALKDSGYVNTNRHGRAVPDWDRFAAVVTLEVPADSDLALAIEFLNREPPQVQTSAHNWDHIPLRGNTQIARAIDAAQRVRNNLFHGGKHTPHSQPGRDQALVQAALVVLLACVSQNKNVGAAYG